MYNKISSIQTLKNTDLSVAQLVNFSMFNIFFNRLRIKTMFFYATF